MNAVLQRPGRAAVTFVLVWLVSATARAEVPPISDADLQSGAELIVTGFVTNVTERDDVSYPAKGQRLVVGHWTVRLHVEAIEKGELPLGSKELSFTGYRNINVPRGWLGEANTMRLTPLVGDEVKVYLTRSKVEWQLYHHLGLWLRR